MTTPAQTSLGNIFQSIRFDNPRMAELMEEDIFTVSLHGLLADKSEGQAAADRLRRQSFDLPEVQKRILNMTLTDLGYS